MPTWRSADARATVKVIAGSALGVTGGVQTRIPITYLDVQLAGDAELALSVDPAQAACVYVFDGALQIGAQRRTASDGNLALLSGGEALALRAGPDGARALVLWRVSRCASRWRATVRS